MAAGFHIGTEEEMNVVVFDFGGGTFDLSVLSINEGVIGVESMRGDMHLGGRDLDQVIVDYCVEEFNNETGVDISEDKDKLNRLYPECERAKKTLDTQNEARI